MKILRHPVNNTYRLLMRREQVCMYYNYKICIYSVSLLIQKKLCYGLRKINVQLFPDCICFEALGAHKGF